MQSSIFPRWSLIACAAASLVLPPVMAAELGEMAVLSHVGQPLLAEIELTALAPDEAQGVAVRLASPDVYRGGGIGMDPALQGLTINPFERGGRRYVRVTTAKAIQSGHLHLYLLLGNGGGAIVRLATLWLTPSPPVASAPARVAAPPEAMPAAPMPLPRAMPGTPPDAAALAARARAEGMLRPATVFVAPPAAPRKAVEAPAVRAAAAVRRRPLRRPVAPVAACAPQADAGQAEACVALDEKNTALNARLGELEGKIGALQQALAQPGAAVAAAAPAAPVVAHAKPKPLAAPVAEKQAGGHGLLWLGLGTLAFLLLTAVIVYVVRKRKQAAGPGTPSKYWVLLRKPFGRKKDVPVLTEAADEAQAAEPEPEPFSR
ncbi:type IV pilus assembly protein FimV [Janthinobacterium sp. 1_2014MBL_MicDiv]|uniref:type IV pilus assembly protein FimV n=1 Tax=Janthinobacterium sp. 1_2014MBL_MicDiv TaxID=1644131 RepID=UPI0008F50F32|nr:hypothetical protein [Janthinobacterium sp. 1_2014MBL_MicDiv]APA69771.1 hypothetical protein YQ44_20520 [Janthinobacterium sp. 1_2014MBL_MicDiv]